MEEALDCARLQPTAIAHSARGRRCKTLISLCHLGESCRHRPGWRDCCLIQISSQLAVLQGDAGALSTCYTCMCNKLESEILSTESSYPCERFQLLM